MEYLNNLKSNINMRTIEDKIINLDEDEAKDMLYSLIEDTYTLIEWPDSQDYMNKKWFKKEAILSEDSSYFIPTKRILCN